MPLISIVILVRNAARTLPIWLAALAQQTAAPESLDYIEHYSLLRDCSILVKTIPAVIRGRGAH